MEDRIPVAGDPTGPGLLRAVDAVMLAVPDLDAGLRFYRDHLHHELLWRNDESGQAGLRLPDGGAELVLSTRQGSAVNWVVTSVAAALEEVVRSGGRVVTPPVDIPVGRVAVVSDPFGNELVLLDLTKGLYVTDADGRVVGVEPDDSDT